MMTLVDRAMVRIALDIQEATQFDREVSQRSLAELTERAAEQAGLDAKDRFELTRSAAVFAKRHLPFCTFGDAASHNACRVLQAMAYEYGLYRDERADPYLTHPLEELASQPAEAGDPLAEAGDKSVHDGPNDNPAHREMAALDRAILDVAIQAERSYYRQWLPDDHLALLREMASRRHGLDDPAQRKLRSATRALERSFLLQKLNPDLVRESAGSLVKYLAKKYRCNPRLVHEPPWATRRTRDYARFVSLAEETRAKQQAEVEALQSRSRAAERATDGVPAAPRPEPIAPASPAVPAEASPRPEPIAPASPAVPAEASPRPEPIAPASLDVPAEPASDPKRSAPPLQSPPDDRVGLAARLDRARRRVAQRS